MSQLYTCSVRCHTCLRELGRKQNTERTPSVMVACRPCPKHQTGMVIFEWEPEQTTVERHDSNGETPGSDWRTA
jgi:hypothetical protein